MSFEPDYPGEYFFQAELSQYGDPVSIQTFTLQYLITKILIKKMIMISLKRMKVG